MFITIMESIYTVSDNNDRDKGQNNKNYQLQYSLFIFSFLNFLYILYYIFLIKSKKFFLFKMAGAVGFEPTPQGFGDPHATVTPDAYKTRP